ncbi:MAG: hypothetical protein R3A52_01615 [Polyangiales bacterium]
MLARFGVVAGAVCAMVCLIGCGGDPVASDAAVDLDASRDDGAPPDVPRTDVVDASGDRGPLVPVMCPGLESPPTILALDRTTNCPTGIASGHAFSSPNTCDSIHVCCNFAPSCEFSTRLTLQLRGPCPSLESSFPLTTIVERCRCEDGQVVCNGSPYVTSWCLDCDLDAPDGGR